MAAVPDALPLVLAAAAAAAVAAAASGSGDWLRAANVTAIRSRSISTQFWRYLWGDGRHGEHMHARISTQFWRYRVASYLACRPLAQHSATPSIAAAPGSAGCTCGEEGAVVSTCMQGVLAPLGAPW